jgi:hypothetical protein
MHMTCELDTVQDFSFELDMKPPSRARTLWLFQIAYEEDFWCLSCTIFWKKDDFRILVKFDDKWKNAYFQ